MAIDLRWVGDDERERVAMARWLCYGHSGNDLAKITDRTVNSKQATGGDFLLAEEDGQLVGTATSLSLTMWARGAPIPCQGVAWVGAAKTARRKGAGYGRSVASTVGDESGPASASPGLPAASPGVATAVMREVLRKGRERGQVISALMPFRASFYEHFGYGLIERRSEWTIPLSILPAGDSGGWRICQPADRPALAAARQRMAERGQCDIERSAGAWADGEANEGDGLRFIRYGMPTNAPATADAPTPKADAMGRNNAPDAAPPATPAPPIVASVFLIHEKRRGKDILRVADWVAVSAGDFKSILIFLGTLRDQYFAAVIQTPADWPVNRLLREPQLPHRLVNHAHAGSRLIARMQARILDHERFLESLRLPIRPGGSAVVAVHDNEGSIEKFRVDFDAGRAIARPAEAASQFTCRDATWAAIACGDLRATHAVRLGLADGQAPVAETLDILADGPLPFSQEYF